MTMNNDKQLAEAKRLLALAIDDMGDVPCSYCNRYGIPHYCGNCSENFEQFEWQYSDEANNILSDNPVDISYDFSCPERRGEWILFYKQKETDKIWHYYYKCSLCGESAQRDYPTKYCANCGAKMKMPD